ncbi:MAG: cytochrome c biogenesis protein ResB [Pseudomonadota bacterium]
MYVVHLSIIVLLIGAMIGSFFGFRGWVNIAEGETIDKISLRKKTEMGKPHPLDFSVRCNDFEVTFYEKGSPKEYRASLTIIENGKEQLTKSIVVNDPLRYKGISFFQSNYGTLPPEKVNLKLADTTTEKITTIEAELHELIKLPNAKGEFEVLDFVPFVGDAQEFGPAFRIKEAYKGKEPIEFWVFEKFPKFDRMRKGEYIYSVENYPALYYTGLEITKDPGVWGVYSGCLLLIAGIIVTFFMSHRQIFMEAVKDRNGSLVSIAAVSNKNILGIEDELKNIAAGLQKLFAETQMKG